MINLTLGLLSFFLKKKVWLNFEREKISGTPIGVTCWKYKKEWGDQQGIPSIKIIWEDWFQIQYPGSGLAGKVKTGKEHNLHNAK
jgi:hypothetical protein